MRALQPGRFPPVVVGKKLAEIDTVGNAIRRLALTEAELARVAGALTYYGTGERVPLDDLQPFILRRVNEAVRWEIFAWLEKAAGRAVTPERTIGPDWAWRGYCFREFRDLCGAAGCEELAESFALALKPDKRPRRKPAKPDEDAIIARLTRKAFRRYRIGG